MGVPLPGETALLAAAIAAKQGDLSIFWVIFAAACGAIIGDNIGYWIGRKGGRRLLEADGPFHARRMALLVHGDRFFADHGPKAVFIGRWVALLRVTAAVLAGANRMDARKFFIWNAAGGIAWATSVGLAGYLLGATAEQLIHRFGIWAGVAGGLVLVTILATVSIRERRALKGEMAEVHRRETVGESMIEWDGSSAETVKTKGEES
jgi:membrane protein DedA with SNARE-associated domain